MAALRRPTFVISVQIIGPMKRTRFSLYAPLMMRCMTRYPRDPGGYRSPMRRSQTVAIAGTATNSVASAKK